MRTSHVIAILYSGFCSLGCSSNWTFKESKSEMDDSARYNVFTESEREPKIANNESWRPFLSVGFNAAKNRTSIQSGPGSVLHFNGPMIKLDGSMVQTGSVKVRFDQEEPLQAKAIETPNQNGVFALLGPESELLPMMLKHKTLKVEWVLAGSGTVIDTFKLDGLQRALLKLCGKAPAACKRDTPIGSALASVGVEVAGGETASAPEPVAQKSPCPSGQELREEKFPNSESIKSRGCVSRNAAGAVLRQGLTETFYQDGKKESAATYTDDVLSGLKTKWHPNGQKWAEVTYKDGKEDGLGTQWLPNGNKEMEFTYRAGVKDGPTTMWHENGQKSAVAKFKNGQLEGAFASWYPNGQKNEELILKNGKKDGLAITWDASGKKTEQVFKDDMPVSSGAEGVNAASGIDLPPGKFAATTPQWKVARDLVVAWCGANAGKCTEQAVDDLKKPADGVLTVGAGAEAMLTTCSPGECLGATFVEFKKAGTAWNVTKVEWSPMGD